MSSCFCRCRRRRIYASIRDGDQAGKELLVLGLKVDSALLTFMMHATSSGYDPVVTLFRRELESLTSCGKCPVSKQQLGIGVALNMDKAPVAT